MLCKGQLVCVKDIGRNDRDTYTYRQVQNSAKLAPHTDTYRQQWRLTCVWLGWGGGTSCYQLQFLHIVYIYLYVQCTYTYLFVSFLTQWPRLLAHGKETLFHESTSVSLNAPEKVAEKLQYTGHCTVIMYFSSFWLEGGCKKSCRWNVCYARYGAHSS